MSDTLDLNSGVNGFGTFDYIVFIGMVAVSLLIGFYHGFVERKKSSPIYHLTASGELSTVPVALSLSASFLSSISLLGQPTEVYLYGPQLWLFGPSHFVMIPIVGYIFIPFFRKRNNFSAYEYFGTRFNGWLRTTVSIIFTVQMVFYLGIVLYAPAVATSQVTGLNAMLVVTVMYLVCILYTTVGGMKAVVWTDAFQVVILMVSLAALLVIGTNQVGGIQVVSRKISQSNRDVFFNWSPDPTQRLTVWSTFVGPLLLIVSTYGCNQLQIQRYLSVRSDREARKILWIAAFCWCSLIVMTTYAGLLIFSTYSGCDPITSKKIENPDKIFPFFVTDKLGKYPGLVGVFLCGIFSAGLSTVSTGMNSLAAIWYSEISVMLREPLDDRQALRMVKMLGILFGVLSYFMSFLMPHLGSLIQLNLSFYGVFAGSILSMFILGMFTNRVKSLGAGTGLLVGLGIMLWILLGGIVAAKSGQIVNQPLPLSTANCTNGSILANTTSTGVAEKRLAFWLYRVSYFWHCPITVVITVSVAVIVTFLIPWKNEKNNIQLTSLPPDEVATENAKPLLSSQAIQS